ncbi:MAG: hypothetical protein R6U86_04005, partial [Bacteroidales bacterium]
MRKFILSFALFVFMAPLGAQPCDPDGFEGPLFFDTYHEIWTQRDLWSIYNVHDPTVLKTDDGFVMYNTDVSMGNVHPVGLAKRTSPDMVHWTWEGTAFDGAPESA